METIKIIARIRSDFPEKFGIPRQSGVVPETRAEIVFEKPYQNPDALRGVLAHDPRPSYQSDPERMYGVAFAGKNVKFTVEDGVLTVRKIEEI